MNRFTRVFSLAVLWLVSCAALIPDAMINGARADDQWPQFRGPDGQGHAVASDVPIEFDKSRSIVWRTPVAGKGWSSPVVVDGRIWLTTAIPVEATEEQRKRKLGNDPMAGIKEVASSVEFRAICIDFETGKVIHDIHLKTSNDPDPINPLNTYASPTPVIHDGMVFCDFGNYGTWCLDAKQGTEVWKAQIDVNYSVGAGSSPYVMNDKLILVCDGIDRQFVLALDRRTGKELWRTPRPPMRATNVEYQKAYSTPISIEVAGKTQLAIPGAQWICGYDPESGKEIWRIDHGDGFSVSPRPIVAQGLVVFSTGYMRPELVAVRADGAGDVSNTHIAWRMSRGAPTKPSPIAVGDRIYVVSDKGVLTQLRASDGSIVWQERLSGNYSASPVQVGNRLYFCSHEGEVTVVGIGESFQELAKNELEARLLASPAVIGSDLIVRSESALMRIGN